MTGRAVELLHAEVDGEITGPQKAELSRLLLADPALRELREGLRRTCEALDALPLEAPPAGLRASIMESLPASPPRCEDRDVRRPVRFGRPVMRYAAAFAGGLIVSALAFQYGLRNETLDAGDLAGTIAGVTVDPSRLELHLDEVRGTVRLEGTASAPVVFAQLESVRPVQVIARLDGQVVRLDGFGAPGSAPQASRAQFSHRSTVGPVRVEVRIVDVASGSVLQATTLRPTVPD